MPKQLLKQNSSKYIGTNIWNLETYRNKFNQKSFLTASGRALLATSSMLFSRFFSIYLFEFIVSQSAVKADQLKQCKLS